MRITGIRIANYRAFRGDSFKLEITDGNNLLIYGENGSGKSSLYYSIQDFLEAASDSKLEIETNRHRFNALPASIHVTLSDRPEAYEWSPTKREQNSTAWRDIDKGKGFLDYRTLFRVHYLPKEKNEIDLFDLLIGSLLPEYKNPASNKTFRDEWSSLRYYFKPYRRKPSNLDARLATFNAGFAQVVNETATKASGLVKRFDRDLDLAFSFTEAHYDWSPLPKHLYAPKVTVRPQFRRLPHLDYERFFNEARLSAIAMSIFFAAVKDCPVSGLRLLVLDDIMIGLDMGNRLVVLRLMEELFADWQIIILTYHKAWFEILKERTTSPRWVHKWKSLVMLAVQIGNDSVPIVDSEESGVLLETAARCLERQDLKAAAVYTRTALETVLQQFSSKWSLRVRFAPDVRDLNTDDFLTPIKSFLDRLVDPTLSAEAETLLWEVKLARRFVLNAFAHQNPSTEDELSGEVGEAIKVVERFEAFLLRLKKTDLGQGGSRASVGQLVLLSRRLAKEGRKESSLRALVKASTTFVQEYLALKGIAFQTDWPSGKLWGAAFPKASRTDREHALMRKLSPYFLGNVLPNHYDGVWFEKAAAFLIEASYGPLIRILQLRSRGLVQITP
jgi:energy-coupling factor transporter ATP-binding protein EcfA2